MRTVVMRYGMVAGLVLGLCAGHVYAQRGGPAASPAAMVQQVVGVEPITIKYASPGVKGRTIWGDLVPYGEVWRAGANAKTTFEFGADVEIDGQALKAGTYGFQILPSETEWELIFSDNPTGNAMQHDPANDVLRVKITPKEAPMRERLAYGFDNMTDDSATIYLHWEKLKGEFTVKVTGGE